VDKAYRNYEFHVVSHAINDFCVVDLSSFYLDIIKDRLYCEERDGLLRRSAQTALFMILRSMTKMFAPILAFTCDEIWLEMPHSKDEDTRNVVFNTMDAPYAEYALDAETMKKWDKLIALRDDINGVLETARAEKRIGKPLEAAVTLRAEDESGKDVLKEVGGMNLKELLIVSSCMISDENAEDAINGAGTAYPGVKISVREAKGSKCPRCWVMTEEADAETGLCPRCRSVVTAMK
jgi:isoleucyl-tRNA synthetase